VFDGGSQRYACVHRDVPHGSAEAEPIDQVYSELNVPKLDDSAGEEPPEGAITGEFELVPTEVA